VRNSPSFQRSIDHGHPLIELHAWRSVERCTFATFICGKASERLLQHFTGNDENEGSVKHWCGVRTIDIAVRLARATAVLTRLAIIKSPSTHQGR
jgi:hypothetical protein